MAPLCFTGHARREEMWLVLRQRRVSLLLLPISVDRGHAHCATGPAVRFFKLALPPDGWCCQSQLGHERWLAGTAKTIQPVGLGGCPVGLDHLFPSSHGVKRATLCQPGWRLGRACGAARQEKVRKQLWEGGCLQSHCLCVVMEGIGARQIDLGTECVSILLAKPPRLPASGQPVGLCSQWHGGCWLDRSFYRRECGIRAGSYREWSFCPLFPLPFLTPAHIYPQVAKEQGINLLLLSQNFH